MTKLKSVISSFDGTLKKKDIEIHGELGTYLRGKKAVAVTGRPGYVYVRLRTNQSEVIQAFNDKVSPSFKLPVVLSWSNGKYLVLRRDIDRYKTWEEDSNYVPRHAKTHSLDLDGGKVGADPVWVYPSQFVPSLVAPFGVKGAENVFIFPYSYLHEGVWYYSGNTGTHSILSYSPTGGNPTSIVLVTLDVATGNPYLFATSGTFIPPTVTGTAGFIPYLPVIDESKYLPLAFVTISSGTSTVGWNEIHDVRPFMGAGGVGITVNGVPLINEIETTGATFSTTGTVAYLDFLQQAGGGGAADSTLFYAEGRLATGTNMSNMYMITQPTTINQIGLYVDYLGITGTTIVDVNLIRSGTTSSIFSTQANRPTLQYNDGTGWILSQPDITAFGIGDVLELDIDSVSTLSDTLVVSKIVTGSSGGGGGSLTVEEADGTPSVTNVQKIKFDGSAVTNDGGGVVTIKNVVTGIYTVQTRTQGIYSMPVSGDGTALTPLDIIFTPKKAGNKIILEWVVNGEGHHDGVFIVTRNGSRLANTTDGSNNRYAGATAVPYDVDNFSTPLNIVIKIIDESSLDVETTYSILVRSSIGSANDFYLNRTVNSAGADQYETTLSTGMAMEIAT